MDENTLTDETLVINSISPTDPDLVAADLAALAIDDQALIGGAYAKAIAPLTAPDSLKQLTLEEYKVTIAFEATTFEDDTLLINEDEIRGQYADLPYFAFIREQRGTAGWINFNFAAAAETVPSITQFSYDPENLGSVFVPARSNNQLDDVLTPNELTNLLLRATIHNAYINDMNARVYATIGIMLSAAAVLEENGRRDLDAHDNNIIATVEYFGSQTNEALRANGQSALDTAARIRANLGFWNKLKDDLFLVKQGYTNFLSTIINRRDAYLVGSSNVLLIEMQTLYTDFAATNTVRANELVVATIAHYTEQTINIIKILRDEHEIAMAAQAAKYEAVILELQTIIEEQTKIILDAGNLIEKYSASLEQSDILLLQLLQDQEGDLGTRYGLTDADLVAIRTTDFSSDFDTAATTSEAAVSGGLPSSFTIGSTEISSTTAYISAAAGTILIGGLGWFGFKKYKSSKADAVLQPEVKSLTYGPMTRRQEGL